MKQFYWDIIHIPYNLPTWSVKFSGLQYTRSYASITMTSFKTLCFPKETLHLLAISLQPTLPPPQTLGNCYSTSCICSYAYSGNFVKMASYNMRSSVTGLFHLACLQGLLVFQHILIIHSLLLLGNIPLIGYTTFYPLISLWTFDGVSAFPLIWIMLL